MFSNIEKWTKIFINIPKSYYLFSSLLRSIEDKLWHLKLYLLFDIFKYARDILDANLIYHKSSFKKDQNLKMFLKDQHKFNIYELNF